MTVSEVWMLVGDDAEELGWEEERGGKKREKVL